MLCLCHGRGMNLVNVQFHKDPKKRKLSGVLCLSVVLDYSCLLCGVTGQSQFPANETKCALY